ncbi:MAG TPA: heat-inducible transcriptional repressor HrcA [Casimicrobiaceae bacterium]|nr:heat-inducible transcriptional repressor HrcA [Casimicrobiaceae bacterium]
MLDRRAQHLLKTLIERYIAEGEPVGSRALSRFSGLELSPATVRNVMADLEETGFLASPHTSAGRVPTPKAYRFFVDSLMVVKVLEQVEVHRLAGELTAERPGELISAAATLLSQLTQFAGVVATPRRRDTSFRHLEFLRLSEHRVLLIIVTPEGDVQNRVLHTERSFTQVELTEATNFFNRECAGKPLPEVRVRLGAELKKLREDIAALMAAAVEAGEGALADKEGVVVAGERNLMSGELVGSVDRMKQLFELFEQKTSLIHLLDSAQQSHGVHLYIGGESGLVPLDEMSVVTARYEVEGRVIGTLGVIGPTRMAYERVIPIVDVTAKLLSNALDKHLAD